MLGRIFTEGGPLDGLHFSSSDGLAWFLLLDALWAANYAIQIGVHPPPDDPDFHLSEESLGNRVQHILNVGVPGAVRKVKSMDLIYDIGHTLCQKFSDPDYWEQATLFFAQLDLVVVEMRNTHKDVEGLNNENVEKWRKLRVTFAKMTRGGSDLVEIFRMRALLEAPYHLQLSDNHFETLPGHGPLLDLDPSGQLVPPE